MALKPKLTNTWWKANKPKTLPKTGIGKALLEIDMAREKRDDLSLVKGLKALNDLIPKAITKTNDKLHKDISLALAQMKQLSLEEIKIAQKRRADTALAEAKAKKEGKVADEKADVPKQKVGKEVVIWKRDLAVDVEKAYKADWITSFPDCKLSLTLNDDILDVLEAESDHTTPAFMVEDAQDLGKQAVDEIVAMIKKIDASVAGKPFAVQKKLRDTLTPGINQIIKKKVGQLEKVPEVRWKKFVAKHQQYRAYKIKAGVNVTIGVLGTAGLVAGIAASHGAGLVIGIVALTRTVSGLVSQCYRLMQDADKVGKDLAEALDSLTKHYQSAAKRAANELGGTVLKSILSVDAPFMQTLPKCHTLYKDWDDKVAGATVAGREASKGILKMLKACEEAEKAFAKAASAEAKKVFKKLAKAREALDKALNKISTLMGKVRNFEKNAPALKKTLDALQGENPKYADIFEKVMPTLVSVGIAAAGAGVSFSGASDALSYYNTAQVLFNDLATEGKAKLEEYLA